MFAQSQHMFCLVLGFILHSLANLSTKFHPLVCPVSAFGLPSLSFSITQSQNQVFLVTNFGLPSHTVWDVQFDFIICPVSATHIFWFSKSQVLLCFFFTKFLALILLCPVSLLKISSRSLWFAQTPPLVFLISTFGWSSCSFWFAQSHNLFTYLCICLPSLSLLFAQFMPFLCLTSAFGLPSPNFLLSCQL